MAMMTSPPLEPIKKPARVLIRCTDGTAGRAQKKPTPAPTIVQKPSLEKSLKLALAIDRAIVGLGSLTVGIFLIAAPRIDPRLFSQALEAK
jgi:hypothetical protein